MKFQKIGQREEEKDLEVVKVAGKGKRSAFWSERDSLERLDRPENWTFNPRPWIIKKKCNVSNYFIKKLNTMYSPISLEDGLHKKNYWKKQI